MRIVHTKMWARVIIFKTALVDIKWIWYYYHMSVNEYKVYNAFWLSMQHSTTAGEFILASHGYIIVICFSIYSHLSTPFIQHISHEM